MQRDRDKELDDLFKNAMQNNDQHIDFREEDWDSMEQLLNRSRKSRVLWLRVASGIAALLLLFAGLWFLKPQLVNDDTTQQAAIKKVKPAPIDTTGKAEKPAMVTPVPNNAQPLTNDPGYAETTQEKPVAQHYTFTPYIPKKKDAPKAIVDNNNTPVIADNPAPVDTTADYIANQSAVQPVQKPDTATVTATNTTEAQVIAATGQSNVKAKKDDVNIRKGLSYTLSVMASPDINGVNSFSESKTGTNLGVLLSVGLGSKFTVSTGAVYSYKPYNTPFGNYRNMAGNVNALTQDVVADCRVLDIPLNIDYNIYNKNKNSFSIGTGLSSYFMLSEKYTINDLQYNTQIRSYTIRGRNQHLFGVMNLQATYHRQLNSKFGVSVQPYFKLPLTDIGYGEVRLRSLGVAAGFSWNINTKRTSGR
jgi:hypothetical protein